MADTHPSPATTVIVEEHVRFSFGDLCSACQAEPPILQALVEEGLLQPSGSSPDDWIFEGSTLPRARTALRLARDLRLSADATVLVVDLLEQIRVLRARLRHAGSA
jgi:chaperone modulatory protein CbpM